MASFPETGKSASEKSLNSGLGLAEPVPTMNITPHSETPDPDDLRAEMGPDRSNPAKKQLPIPRAIAEWTEVRHIESYSQLLAKVAYCEINRAPAEPRGNALLISRKSTVDPDAEGGVNQAKVGLEAAAKSKDGIEVDSIIIVSECSGARSFEARPDLLLAAALMRQRRYESIVVRDATRISRSQQTFLDVVKFTRSAQVRLFLAWNGRVFDPDDIGDSITAAIAAEYAAYERTQIRRRTMAGTFDKRFEPGKGAPGVPPFGFAKDADGWLIQNLEAWKWVRVVAFINRALDVYRDLPDNEIARVLKVECEIDMPVARIRSLRQRRKR